jgi:ribosomal protein L11 methyltransferase
VPPHAAPAPDALVVRVDPGLAFGTGHHASRRLALDWLVGRVCGGECVLDYGCGSGILALAAARLGDRQVSAVDSDPQALAVAAANAQANGVALRLAAPEALAGTDYDLVVANILAQPLIDLEPRLAALTGAGGRIALAGFLEEQAAVLAAAYARDFALAAGAVEAGWVLLEGEHCA